MMKTIIKRLLPLWLSLSLIACQKQKTVTDLGFLEIDVTEKYPVKELILEDIADVWYVLPQLHDDYLYSGSPRLVTDDYIITYERNTGDFAVFDNQGVPLHKFNKKGQGPGEYTHLYGIIYDKVKDELFIKTYEKILVYSLTGDFKRVLSLYEHAVIPQVKIFDDTSLLCYDDYERYPSSFFLISRENGELMEEIDIKYSTKLSMHAIRTEGGMTYMVGASKVNIVQKENGFLLTEHSMDTVYFYSKDKQLTSVLKRTPPIVSMDPYIYLNAYLDSPFYLFMSVVSTTYNWDTQKGFETSYLMLDKSNGQMYEQRILLSEYKNKEISLDPLVQSNINANLSGMITLNASQLQDALDDGRLSGQLKDIVSKMDEDANNLLLFFRFKE